MSFSGDRSELMLPSRSFFLTGVGVFIACSHAVPVTAQLTSEPVETGSGNPAALTASPDQGNVSDKPAVLSPTPGQPTAQTVGNSGLTGEAAAQAPAPAAGAPAVEEGGSKPIGPAKPGDAPEYLNPDPNPLLLPTKPEQVKLLGIQPITLQQAIALALRNNLGIQVPQLQVERSRAGLREAQSANFPTLALQWGISRSQSATSELSERAQRDAQRALPPELRQPVDVQRTSRGLSGTLTLNYDVFTSGRRAAQIRAAASQVRSDELAVETNLEELRLNVASDYYDLQGADEAVRIARSAVRNAEASLRDTQALERAGLGTRFDVLRAEVQLADNQQELNNSLALQQRRQRQLAQRLNLPPTLDLAAADPVQVAGEWKPSLEDSIIQAFRNRSELEQQLAQREAADQQRRASLAQLGPQLNVSATYNIQDSFTDPYAPGKGYSVAAGINWNLFDGGAAVAGAQQQEANRAIAETRFADLRNQIRLQVEDAYYNLRSNRANIETTTRALEQAKEALRLARLRFQAGVGTQTDVINAENDLTRAEGNRVTAILGYNRALAQMVRAVSNLPIKTGEKIPTLP